MGNYVYFITDGQGHIKIGVADSVKNRLKTMQTGNAYELRVLAILSVGCMKDAYEIEKYLHHLFQSDRIRGEWFTSKNIIDFLMQDKYWVPGYTFTGFAKIRSEDEKRGFAWA